MTIHASGSNIQIPSGPLVDKEGNVTPAWRLWLLNPNVQTLDVGTPITPINGGTGSTGGAIPSTLNPVLTGDVTSPGGTTLTTLGTVNGSPGTYGTGTNVASVQVNAKGLTLVASNVPITGAPGPFTAVGAFGCNTKSAQSAYASGGSVVTTGATNAAPYGYTTAAQANAIVTLLNNIQAALVANGIMS
jgi:hypothetical protein